GSIEGDESACGAYDPGIITSLTEPTGGSGALEYQWLSATDECPRFEEHQIPGANGPTYDPGPITVTTYFVRCVRRQGCTELADWKESNCVVKTVETDCEPDCKDVSNHIEDYIYVGEFNNSKYYCSNGDHFTWAEAKAKAEAIGGYLVVINDAQENEYLRSNIMNPDIWIGFTDVDDEGNFTWVNGDPVDYTNWNAGEPNNVDNSQHFARLLQSNGKWTDREATYTTEFVVEIPCKSFEESTPIKSCKLENHGKADHDTESRLLWLNFDHIGIKEYSVVAHSSTFTEFEDGTALIEGLAERTDDNCFKWAYSVRLINKRSWAEWSVLGRDYKANNYIDDEDHTTWDYYELDPANSFLIGEDCNEGKTLFLTHQPADYTYGFQIGDGANVKNAVFGLSGWFAFTGSFTGHGDFNGNLEDCKDLRTITLGDFVWEDLNANGIQDADEPGIANVQVQLFGNDLNGTEVSEFTATDNNGAYSFSNILAGTYRLIFSNVPGGFFPTAQNQGGDDAKDSDINPADGATEFITFGPATEDFSIDAGYYKFAEVGDFVWNDLDADGLRDPGEPGLKDAVITLSGTDGAGNPVSRSTTSGSNGIYFFNGIVPGNYKLTFSAPNGFIPSPQNQGTDENQDSDIDPITEMTDFFNLISGSNNDQIDAAYYKPVQISGLLWIDENVDGLLNNGESGKGGIDVMLLDADGNTLTAFPTIQTANDGSYSFENLLPGSYSVKFGPLADEEGFTLPDANGNANDDIDSDVNPGNGQSNLLPLFSAQEALNLNAGIFTRASFGDMVWEDLNANGIMDDGEPGIENVQVQLLGTDAFGNAVNLIDNTNENGKFDFTALIPGTYKLIFSNQPAGFLATAQGQGSDEAKDSDADPINGMTAVEFLGSGEDNDQFDAGYFRFATIGNFVWEDTNGNGIKDITETGIPNLTVQLTGTDGLGNPVNQIKSTSGNGTYFFDALIPGDYKVTFSP
ncbi:MAG: SdrD B-like domain-containing protein, partial [Bacteroidota bacterium]